MDGSRQNNTVGSAFIILCNDNLVLQETWRISDHPTVFQAEVMAIHFAVDSLTNMDVMEVLIYITTLMTL